LRHLSINDNMHFNEIKRLLGISSNVLAKKLKQLEQEGLVIRKAVFEDSPLRVEYKLTPLAKELDAIFIDLDKWIDKWESRN
jgi:DNA-binding HxlR family transcriptional regulator